MTTVMSLANVGLFGSTTVLEMAQRIRQGTTTALEVTEQTLEAINESRQLNCFITVDSDGARAAARAADKELASGHDRGPLHGIPIGVKDLLDTKNLKTTMGSLHFADHIPDADAVAVSLMRRAGAVIVGKTHTHEFAFGATGDRAHTGPALNPQDTSRVTGGSSSGSAAAVAAGLVPIALGSDAAGSARIPGALCGAVGLRPTAGSVSLEGGFPLSQSLDVISPLARTVTDTSVAWWALSSAPQVWSSSHLPDPACAAQLRISRVKSELTDRVASTGQAKALSLATNALAETGTLISDISIPEIDECSEPHKFILFSEAYANHASRVMTAPELFDEEVLSQLHAASQVKGWEYIWALETRARLRSAVLERLSSIDILILPTVPIDPPLIGQRTLTGEAGWNTVREALKSFTVPWSLLDLPAISVPIPVEGQNMPGAIQLVGKPGQELQLLNAAAAVETALVPAQKT